eukprot:1076176-Pleurochrysis_carterae.AAC.1
MGQQGRAEQHDAAEDSGDGAKRVRRRQQEAHSASAGARHLRRELLLIAVMVTCQMQGRRTRRTRR